MYYIIVDGFILDKTDLTKDEIKILNNDNSIRVIRVDQYKKEVLKNEQI